MSKKMTPAQQAIVSASDAGLHATTIVLANKLLESEPENLRALIDLGHALWQFARYLEAETAFNRALELCDEAKRDVIYGELGNLNLARGDFKVATEWFEKQIATDPADAAGYLFLGSLQLRHGNVSAATDTLERGIACEYGCLEDVHLTLGIAYTAQERFLEAAKQFEASLEIDPQNGAAKIALKDVRNAKA